MSSNFGPRNVENEKSIASWRYVDSLKPKGNFANLEHVTIASSRLVVVRAFLIASQIVETLLEYGLDASFEEMNWGDSVVLELSKGRLSAAVYNSLRGNHLISERHLDAINTGVIGHSMGGRNFCILAHSHGKWNGVLLSELADNFNSAPLIVGRNTDRFSNILDVLGISSEGELPSRGIEVVDIPDASPAILSGMKDAIMVCGQNRRFEVEDREEILELQGFANLPPQVKERIRSRSANSLFVSESLLNKVDLSGEELFRTLMGNFNKSWLEAHEDHLALVSHGSEFDFLSLDERLKAVRSILYETYRFGSPQ